MKILGGNVVAKSSTFPFQAQTAAEILLLFLGIGN
jgi:hypothetical protein